MQSLDYYEFDIEPSEAGKNNNFQNGKLYSKFRNEPDNSSNLNNILYSPSKNEGYTAHMKIPKIDIEFYDFSTLDGVERLDDFMASSEINSTLGFFVKRKK